MQAHEHCSIEHKDTGIFLANEQKTKAVTLITLIAMVGEVVVGYWSGSMSLLADGWHMASHALALGLSLVVYYLYRHPKFRSSFTFGGGKILSLGGYTSALFLVMIALSMIWESVTRFKHLHEVHYTEAMVVAVLGLFINLICAWILHSPTPEAHVHTEACRPNKLAPHTQHGHHHHRGHHHHAHDHNHESAYMHILSDALTSVLAIIALFLGMWQGWSWADPAVGILGGCMVLKWSFGIIRQSGKDLLDAHDVSIDRDNLVKKLQEDGSQVLDIHLWKLAPDQIGCELVIRSAKDLRSKDYRDIIRAQVNIHHLIIEVV